MSCETLTISSRSGREIVWVVCQLSSHSIALRLGPGTFCILGVKVYIRPTTAVRLLTMSRVPPSGGVGGGLLVILGQFVSHFVSARISDVSATYQRCISVSALSRS